MGKTQSKVCDLNPYKDIDNGSPESLRLSVDVLRNDVFKIRSVVMDYGFLNTAMGLFVKHLCNYVNNNNLTIADRERLIEYVQQLTGAGTGGNPAGCSTDRPNVGGDDSSLGRPASDVRAAGERETNVEQPSGGKQTAKAKRTRRSDGSTAAG